MYHEMRGRLHLAVLRFRIPTTYVSLHRSDFVVVWGRAYVHTPSLKRPLPPLPLIELARQPDRLLEAQGHTHGRRAGAALYLHHLGRGVVLRR